MNRRLRCFLAAFFLCAPCAAQQAAPVNSPVSNEISKAREALKAAEAAHPGNTPEVAPALNDLVSSVVDSGTADAETLALVTRQVQLEETLEGRRSKAYVSALDTQADLMVALNRASDACAIAEQAFEIGQKELPDSSESEASANALGRICSSLGDFPCAVRAHGVSVELARKIGGSTSADPIALNNLGAMKSRMGDVDGAIQAEEEALAIAYRLDPTDNHIGVIENNLGSNYLKAQNFNKAADHLNRAVDMLGKLYGPESQRLMQVNRNVASLYTRTGQFPLAWKAFEFSLKNQYEQMDMQATNHSMFAQSLAQGGNPQRAVEEGLISARMSREIFVLQARTLPERQALAYDGIRPHGLDTAISVVLKHPELPLEDIYREVVRSRAW